MLHIHWEFLFPLPFIAKTLPLYFSLPNPLWRMLLHHFCRLWREQRFRGDEMTMLNHQSFMA